MGLYTSPYIYRFHERMQVNGVEISDEDLIAITEYVKPLAQSMEVSPTEFELVCCIAFEYFARQNCDIVVLEVGMGGAFDATNVIECPEVAVITNIGLDHTDFLGNTLEEIAATKAGIFKTIPVQWLLSGVSFFGTIWSVAILCVLPPISCLNCSISFIISPISF